MPYRAFVLAFAAAALFGAATPFSKSLLAGLQANQMAGLLYLGAALLLAPGVIRRARVGGALIPTDTRNRLQLLGAIFFGGLLGPVLLLVGLRAALAASVSMWLNLETVATAFLAGLLFKEHLGRWTWLGNIGVLASGILLSLDGGRAGLLGILCVGGAAICWGFDNNFTAVIDGITPQLCTFWKGLIAGAANLLIGAVFFPVHLGPDWLGALLLGGVSYGASIVLYISAAQRLGATRSQMVFASSPFFGVLLSVWWLGERMSALQWAAGGLLAASIGVLFLDQHGHEHQHVELTHEHVHSHDEAHHEHEHPETPPATRHSHPHTHSPIRHSHPHWPDLHHRHPH
jgi:drug/metabolite transporter (DMT)-like permease